MEMVILLMTLALCGAGALVGLVASQMMWRKQRAKVLAAAPQVVEYELIDTLTPAEFCLLVTGTITHATIQGQLAYLVQKGVVNVRHDKNGVNFEFRRGQTANSDEATTLRDLLGGSNQHISVSKIGPTALDQIKASTLNSLRQKGWLGESSEISRDRFDYWLLAATCVLVVATIACVMLLATSTGLQQNVWFLATVILALLIISLIVTATFVRSLSFMLSRSSHIARSITPKYRADYTRVHGVYTYLVVAGLDTMTPDYDDLSSIASLDRLYPYAVAVGLDKKLRL